MLMPKRVKRRRVHRGRMTGKCTKGNTIAYGDYGLVALEPAWIKSSIGSVERLAIVFAKYFTTGNIFATIEVFNLALFL